MRQIGQWKDHRLPSQLDKNRTGRIEAVTGEAFRRDDDWQKLEKLTDIEGIAASVASVILHLYDEKKYPILDRHALNSIGIDDRKVNYDECFWRDYTNFCRVEAKRFDVEMRTLDRARYELSKADAAAILKIMPEEMLLTQLTRRGYTESDPQENNTQKAKIVKTQ